MEEIISYLVTMDQNKYPDVYDVVNVMNYG